MAAQYIWILCYEDVPLYTAWASCNIELLKIAAVLIYRGLQNRFFTPEGKTYTEKCNMNKKFAETSAYEILKENLKQLGEDFEISNTDTQRSYDWFEKENIGFHIVRIPKTLSFRVLSIPKIQHYLFITMKELEATLNYIEHFCF